MNEFRKGLRKGFISLACALDAADEIERLEAERDALRAQLDEACEALEPFAKWCDEMEFECPILRDDARVASDITMADVRRARAVYEKIKGGGDE